MMADLGKAYVQIVPSAKGISGSISKVLNGEATSAGGSAGATIGKSLVSTAMKVISAAGIGKAFAASLTAAGELQQSVGGVETIFKNSADRVQEYARTAYKRAGVSANDYMEQVTSFSASLLQSLGGDTAKAAEYADRAMVDMSDNANKFGTNIQDIQNAYQGFAKQNYTMLDNLKLGYGGTKTEMQRLISDASKMTDAMDALGVSVDGTDMSFANIVNAIAVVQKDMEISGTTAKEAATTFSGSFGMMKAAATDFMASLAGLKNESGDAILEVQASLENLVDSVSTFVFGNLLPMAANIAVAFPNAIITYLQNNAGNIQNAASQMMQGLSTGMTQTLPSVLTKATNMATSIMDTIGSALPEGLPNVLSKILPMITSLSSTIREKASVLIDSGLALIENLAKGIANSLPTLIQEIPTIVTNIAGIINDNAPKVLASGVKIIITLAQGIIKSIPTLIANIPKIIQAIVASFSAFNWVSIGSTIVKGIGSGLSQIGQIVKNIPKTFQTVIESTNWVSFGNKIINGIKLGVTSAFQTLRTVASELVDVFKVTITETDWITLGIQILTWIGNGILSLVSWLWSTVTSIFNTVVSKIKEINWLQLGIDVLKFIGNGIMSLGTWLWSQTKSLFSTAVAKVKEINWRQLGTDILRFIVNGIMSLTSLAVSTLVNIASSMLSSFKNSSWYQAGSEALSKIRNGVSSVVGSLTSTFASLRNQAMNQFKQGGWAGVGSWIVSGIVSGVSGAAGRLYSSLRSMAYNALSAAKRALKIGSPSKVFEKDFGKWLPAGAAEGVEEDTTLKQAIDKMAEDTITRAQVKLGDMKANVSMFDKLKSADGVQAGDSTVFNQTINSAKALSPSEIAVETQAMMRRMKWA